MQFQLDDNRPKADPKKTSESGLVEAQSSEEIERELHDKLASLGINLSGGVPGMSRSTQALPTASDDKRTTVLDIADLRSALRQQIGIAEIKREIERIIRLIIEGGAPTDAHTQDLELRASALMIPYCREYIPDFPPNVRPSEFAVDLNLSEIIDFHVDLNEVSKEEIDEMVEQYAMQIIQTLLSHPLIPQKAAKSIGIDLKTTALKDERGTAMYSSTDAQFLRTLFNEQKILERGGEVGLLAILISAKKWNKIDTETLFVTAVHYTLEAMAKKRGIPGIVLRGQGEDHPIAYILGEYIAHNLDHPLESLINFIEDFLKIAREAIQATPEEFIQAINMNYLPKLKSIFGGNIHESFDRFIDVFRREFQESQRTIRNKIFFFKRIGDLCEVAFYGHEAICALESASGEVYAKEKLDEGTKHFAARNNIPIDETTDFLSQKNSLSEVLVYSLKQRWTVRDSSTLRAHFVSKLMNDLLFFLDSLRRVFDHSYARGRATATSDYNSWEEVVADCSRGYARIFFGRSLSDIERYHFENIYKKLIERHLSFFDLQTPMLFQSSDFKLEKFAKSKSPEDNLKEHFLKFFLALHQALLNFDPAETEAQSTGALKGIEPAPAAANPAARSTQAFTLEAVQARVFLAQSEMPLSDYTLEALSAAITPDAKDKVILVQALRAAVDLASKARIAEEIHSMNLFLQNLRQRVSLLYVLTDQEKEQWRSSISASLSELEQIDPIALSSYGLVLSGIDDWEISHERIQGEWKNPDTSIMRMQQLFFILLLKHPDAMRRLVEEYRRWLSTTQFPADSARKKAFERRMALLDGFVRRGSLKLSMLRWMLMLMQYVQMSVEVTNWERPRAYILEDLLAVETPLKRVREISAILSTKEPAEVRAIVDQFVSVLNERCQQSASGYSYYTDEEKSLMETRRRQFDALAARPPWQAKRDRVLFSLARLLTRPFSRLSSQEQKN